MSVTRMVGIATGASTVTVTLSLPVRPALSVTRRLVV